MDYLETQLKKLILDEDFNSIQNMVHEEVNLMSILRIESKELQHSNLLAWLFDPNGTHGLKDYFIKEFIKLFFIENEYQDLGLTSTKLSVFDFVDLDFDDVEILREHKNIDILITSKANQLCIVIENKIFAREGRGQLKKYRNQVENDYPDYKHKVFIYLSLFEQEISEQEKDYYVQLTYDHIVKLITQILNAQGAIVGPNTRFVLQQYLQTLKSIMNDNEAIEKIAKDMYSKYKSAFDLVFKYTSPSNASIVPHNLVELISNEDSIRPFSTSRSYVRFQPNFLYDHIEDLKNAGLISKDDDLKSNWLLLFEFHVTRQYIHFDMKIGEYADPKCRERLYDLFLSHKKVFTKVEKPNGELKSFWHQAFQKKIVSSAEYNEFLESGEDSLNSLIEKRFRTLIDVDLKKIQSVFEEAFT